MIDTHNDNSPAVEAQANASLEQENAKLRQRIADLERLVTTDTLTPLFNRRYFMEELDRWCWRAKRYQASFGLLFCDVDDLKSVNDTYGHAIGDDLLLGTSVALVASVRKSDIVSRVGGDEFTILLDNITPEQLAKKTASMRKLFDCCPIVTSGPDLNVAMSIGSAQITAGSNAADILEYADKQMYAHKRNRIIQQD
jgi:diguanylate cyclase (GGDEF)-like protein